MTRFKQLPWILVPLLVLGRLLIYLAMPLDGLHGYGDFLHFYQLASLPGWPYFNYWSEFPPVFPFLSAVLFRLSGGQEHVYDYLLIFILLLADAGSLYFFIKINDRTYAGNNSSFCAAWLILFFYSLWPIHGGILTR